MARLWWEEDWEADWEEASWEEATMGWEEEATAVVDSVAAAGTAKVVEEKAEAEREAAATEAKVVKEEAESRWLRKAPLPTPITVPKNVRPIMRGWQGREG